MIILLFIILAHTHSHTYASHTLNMVMMILLLNIDWNLQALTDCICINARDADYMFIDNTNSISDDILSQFLFISRFLVQIL